MFPWMFCIHTKANTSFFLSKEKCRKNVTTNGDDAVNDLFQFIVKFWEHLKKISSLDVRRCSNAFE